MSPIAIKTSSAEYDIPQKFEIEVPIMQPSMSGLMLKPSSNYKHVVFLESSACKYILLTHDKAQKQLSNRGDSHREASAPTFDA